jgi:hypothetical protein
MEVFVEVKNNSLASLSSYDPTKYTFELDQLPKGIITEIFSRVIDSIPDLGLTSKAIRASIMENGSVQKLIKDRFERITKAMELLDSTTNIVWNLGIVGGLVNTSNRLAAEYFSKPMNLSLNNNKMEVELNFDKEILKDLINSKPIVFLENIKQVLLNQHKDKEQEVKDLIVEKTMNIIKKMVLGVVTKKGEQSLADFDKDAPEEFKFQEEHKYFSLVATGVVPKQLKTSIPRTQQANIETMQRFRKIIDQENGNLTQKITKAITKVEDNIFGTYFPRLHEIDEMTTYLDMVYRLNK